MKSRLIAVLITALLFSLAGCDQQNKSQNTSVVRHVEYESYRDIPGLSENQKKAVAQALEGKTSFTYGMLDSTECFTNQDGSKGGYASLICQWLTKIFGVKFEPKIFQWSQLRDGIKDQSIDFSGDFTPLGGAESGYYMTDAISERKIMYASKADGLATAEILKNRSIRIAFLRGAAAIGMMIPWLENDYGDQYELVEVEHREEALQKLAEGAIDIFLADASALEVYDNDPALEIRTFPHLAFKKVAITTCNAALSPIIEVIDQYIRDGALMYLNELYSKGMEEYQQHTFLSSLSDEETRWYQERIAEKKPIPIGLTSNNYPMNFYDEKTQKWDGIALDILTEIRKITKLKFEMPTDISIVWADLFHDLEEGSVPMVAGMVFTESRSARFRWTEKPYTSDRYALVSTNAHPDLNTNQILYSRVGVIRDTAYEEMFNTWFPSHKKTVQVVNQMEGFNKLDTGEIDLLMTTQNHFTYPTNYLEKTNYKINILFDSYADYHFGFNIEESLLASIVGKAQNLVDTEGIANRWAHRTFDYQRKISESQNIFLMGLSALFLLVIILLYFIVLRRKKEQLRLQSLVDERTSALAEQVEKTQTASEAKSSFLANMSHEMRTPLNAVIGFSELSLGSDSLSGEIRENIQKIYRAGETLLGTVNDILDISKIESGKFEIIPVKYDIPSLINDVVTLNIMRIAEKPIEFKLDLDGDFPNMLRGDELRVKQMFNNLLSNAFKYTKEGEVRWELKWKRDGDSVWIISVITDTGIGIRQEDMDRLFTDYNQVDTKANRTIEGTGLGLAITQKLVELMDGTIHVESEYGQGAAFTIRFRQTFVSEAPIGKDVAWNLKKFTYTDNKLDANTKMVRIRLPYARVLLVDDLITNLDVAKGMMKPYGMEIDTAISGEECIDLVRNGKKQYDAIFMDHMMPVMDGIEATRIIREEIDTEYAKNIPIIALTANAVVGNEEKFLLNGFQAFLSKPIEIHRLDAVIRQWIRNKDKERAYAEEQGIITLGEEKIIDMRKKGSDRRSGQDRRYHDRRQVGEDKLKEDDRRLGDRRRTDAPMEDISRRFYVKGLDLKAILSRFSGDETSVIEVLQSYVDHTGKLLEQIRDVNEAKLPDYAITVHGIKGSSRGIYAEPVGAKAEAQEKAAKAGDIDFILKNKEAFIEETKQLISGIRGLLESCEGGRDSLPVKPSPDPDILIRLKEACAEYDMDAVDKAMSALTAFKYETNGELVDWLKDRVEEMNFQEVCQRLEK